MTFPEVHILVLRPDQWQQAFPVVTQLRSLTEDEFLARVREQALSGYELVGAFANELVGIMGCRPMLTLSRGPHLLVDDLVVDEGSRSLGIGAKLIAFAAEMARQRQLTSIYLSARSEAVRFYERHGFQLHHAPTMKKGVTIE